MLLRASLWSFIVLGAAACASGPTSAAAPTTGDVPAANASDAGTVSAVASNAPPSLPSGSSPSTETRTDGLQITVLKPGSGPRTKSGDRLRVQYVGTLDDGTEFDSSRKPGRTPFVFSLGNGSVIKGWDEGMAGMQVGELRKLVIPAHLAYGETARPGLPANSRLTFEVELLGIE